MPFLGLKNTQKMLFFAQKTTKITLFLSILNEKTLFFCTFFGYFVS